MNKFKSLLLAGLLVFSLNIKAQDDNKEMLDGACCTSIMVGKNASTDGSVITSHTCDGRYRTWMRWEAAADHKEGEMHKVYKGTMHTEDPFDNRGPELAGEIPEVAHTYRYLNTAYPCLNEKQLAIGETTFSGPDTLVNNKGMFMIEELERVALQRCDNARDAIQLIGKLVKEYGYGDGGECITIADKNEVWQMEILGEGPDKIGGVWAAKRIPDDEVGVSANISRIGKLERKSKDFYCSDNCESVAKKYGLWDGKGEFVFYKAFHSSYGGGKNFSDREFFILSQLAPSLNLTRDMEELPFSVKPDENVDVLKVMELYQSTQGPYRKRPGEDLNSILTGLLQSKGKVHVHICSRLTEEDLSSFDPGSHQNFFRQVAALIDERVCSSYRLTHNNYIAKDLLSGDDTWSAYYTAEQKAEFLDHMSELDRFSSESDIKELSDIFLKIYASPVDSRELFGGGRSEVVEEATRALIMLGFTKQAVTKAVQAVLKAKPDAKVEQIIKSAPQMM